ncbi:MAG: nucleoside triphosphate pyrophosphohydrolase [Luminiphilus sp.]|jgi:ATP diphosphatase|nr:nucleoside triphosphate pyrophosphohydrolase [Luminiphilus sp.]MDG1460830.1 nucleoside triphosphate pyrophosphohydrolase [Luminiphilus sp.]
MTGLTDVHKGPEFDISDLLRIMERLRDPSDGCPWDVKQTFTSVIPHTLEECYELVDAIQQGDLPHVAEELGDVLFQVIFYSELGKELGAFDFHAVVEGIARKLLRRHPHVFAEGAVEGRVLGSITTDEVKANWEVIKRKEKVHSKNIGVLADVPKALPALSRAQKLQKRAATVGFDWGEVSGALAKLKEEMDEFQHAVRDNDGESMAEELGDLIFSAVNVARHLGYDAESVLRQANDKFEMRFSDMETAALEEGSALSDESNRQMEARWQSAKSRD